MFKKKYIYIFIVLLIIPVFTACNKKADTIPTILTIWSYYNGAQKKEFEHKIEEFNDSIGREYNVIIKHKSFGNIGDLNRNLIISSKNYAGAHPMPDLFITYKGIGIEINKYHQLLNFKEYYSDEELDTYVDEFIKSAFIIEEEEEKLVMFPIAKSSDIMIINDALFKPFMKKAHIDYSDLETYEGLVEVARKYYDYTDSLTPELYDGKALFGIDSVANYFFISLKQLGVNMLSEKEGQTILNLSKEHAKIIWDNYYIPVVKGYVGKKGKYVSEDMKIGNLLIGLSYTTSATYFPKEVYINNKKYDAKIKVMHSPYIKGEKKFFISQGGGVFCIDSNKEKNKKAVRFVKWITQKENNLEFAVKSSYFPVKKEALKKDVILEFEKNNKINNDIINTLNIGINQFEHMTSYTPDVLDGYEEVRVIIEKEFTYLAKKNAKKVRDRVLSGESYHSAIKYYISDEYFDNWYDSFVEKINFTLQTYSK